MITINLFSFAVVYIVCILVTICIFGFIAGYTGKELKLSDYLYSFLWFITLFQFLGLFAKIITLKIKEKDNK